LLLLALPFIYHLFLELRRHELVFSHLLVSHLLRGELEDGWVTFSACYVWNIDTLFLCKAREIILEEYLGAELRFFVPLISLAPLMLKL